MYPGRYPPVHELMHYLTELRDIAVRAAAEGLGLVICRYEDW